MALIQHSSLTVRFQQQIDNAQSYLIPFIEEVVPVKEGLRVMEIGCGEGGVLKPFMDRGCQVLGVDLSVGRIGLANEYLAEDIEAGKGTFVAKNVYDEDFRTAHQQEFDLILLKDTIEHIPDQEKFIPYILQFLKPSGRIFFGFPPWRMPFGGHQQVCKSKVLGFTPYFHLLPYPLYRGVLKAFGETARNVEALIEIKDTGISTHRFEKIIRENQLIVEHKKHFLFNPIYKYKFGVTPREQASWLTSIPHLRDFFTTAGWYIIKQPE